MPHARVRDFMTKEPVTLHDDDRLREAVEMVMVRRIRHIPILDAQQPDDGHDPRLYDRSYAPSPAYRLPRADRSEPYSDPAYRRPQVIPLNDRAPAAR